MQIALVTENIFLYFMHSCIYLFLSLLIYLSIDGSNFLALAQVLAVMQCHPKRRYW